MASSQSRRFDYLTLLLKLGNPLNSPAIDRFFTRIIYFSLLTTFLALVGTLYDISWSKAIVVIGLFAAALAFAMHSTMRTFGFAAWVVVVVVSALLYPAPFLQLGPIKGVDSLTYLIQIAMFGMGATLTHADFLRVLKMPKGVVLGFALQFSVMPLLGWSIATVLRLPPEIAVGVILVGCCPGGVSSNVITYLAKGNVALSVTMTACTTLASPIMTTSLMYLLAGRSIPIDYFEMFRNICLTVFAPVIAGLIFNSLMNRWKLGGASMDRYLAVVAMIAICLICGIIAANSSNDIKQVGPILLTAVLLHNLLGYLLGYGGAKMFGMNEADSRTIAIEVGLQNGGMAAMLATKVLKLSSAAIAPAIFAPVMNVTGSLLAAWWGRSHSDTKPLL